MHFLSLCSRKLTTVDYFRLFQRDRENCHLVRAIGPVIPIKECNLNWLSIWTWTQRRGGRFKTMGVRGTSFFWVFRKLVWSAISTIYGKTNTFKNLDFIFKSYLYIYRFAESKSPVKFWKMIALSAPRVYISNHYYRYTLITLKLIQKFSKIIYILYIYIAYYVTLFCIVSKHKNAHIFHILVDFNKKDISGMYYLCCI